MKYENFNQVNSLCSKINSWEKSLSELNDRDITIEICSSCGFFSKIKLNKDTNNPPHEYNEPAEMLINTIKEHLEHKIREAKEQLAGL